MHHNAKINENAIKILRQEARGIEEAISEMKISTLELLSINYESIKLAVPYIDILKNTLYETLDEVEKMFEPATCISKTLNEVADAYEEIWFGNTKITK